MSTKTIKYTDIGDMNCVKCNRGTCGRRKYVQQVMAAVDWKDIVAAQGGGSATAGSTEECSCSGAADKKEQKNGTESEKSGAVAACVSSSLILLATFIPTMLAAN